MFDATKDNLSKILERAALGEIQLPEFQRDYVWGDDDVRSLLASVAQGFPIGAILTLEAGGTLNFKPRSLSGFEADPEDIEVYLLDGQQRTTSLGQSLFRESPVRTINQKGKRVERLYYIDIEQAVSGEDFDAAIIGVPADKVVRENFGRDIKLDLSSAELEYSKRYFPLNKSFDSRDWLYGWREFAKNNNQDIDDLERAFYKNILRRIELYQVPIIQLSKANTRAAICQVFEKVNVGGKKLDAFELVTAIYAGDNFDIRADWFGGENQVLGRRQRIIGERGQRDVMKELASTDFLQASTVLHTRARRAEKHAEGKEGKELPAISCRRDSLLQLPVSAYQEYADLVEEGFRETSRFMNERKIISQRDVPYPPQMVTLAAVFALLGNEGKNDAARKKLDRWFWCTTFGELYGSSTESRIAYDVPELVEWVQGSETVPRSVQVAVFQKSRLLSLRTRLSAAYKGMHAYIMKAGCLDFVSGRPADIATFFEDKMDIHHIFPQDWCKKHGIEPATFNSIVNKTPLSRRTNIRIGGHAPSHYLKLIEERDGISPERLDEILSSHLIEPELLRNDDFDGFFKARTNALAEMVGGAMGKAVVQEEGADEAEIDVVEPEETDGQEPA